jgi:hypothetical protein
MQPRCRPATCAFDLFNQARAFTSADVKSQFAQINKIQDEGVAAAQKRHDRSSQA